MNIDHDRIQQALIDISDYDLTLGDRDTVQGGELPGRAAAVLQQGYAVCYGTGKVLARHGLDVRRDRERGLQLLESLFASTLARVDTGRYSVTDRDTTVEWMDFDGYNLNENFSHDGQIAARQFMTTKCLHFDAATPFIGNIYGPNDNIRGGHPLICDTRQYCLDRGVDPRTLVQSIPNNYNVAVRQEHYDDLLDNYSFALQVDLDDDIVLLMLLNEVAHGVAHGATDAAAVVAGQPASRPMRHIEMQYPDQAHYDEWYAAYGLDQGFARDYQGENLSLDYYDTRRRFDTFVPVG